MEDSRHIKKETLDYEKEQIYLQQSDQIHMHFFFFTLKLYVCILNVKQKKR